MGTCTSCEASPLPTSKVILQDGRLEEFSYPIKASYITQKDPKSFICNSDDMDFGVGVFPVGDNEELQPGQIYFSLPLEKLRRPLTSEEMAALAVRASSALMKYGYRSPPMPPMLFSGEKVAPVERRRGSKGGSGDFRVQLSAIPE